jgi:hypothetical protein
MAAIAAIPVDATMLDRIMAAGHLAGAWPAAHRFSPWRNDWIRPQEPSRDEAQRPGESPAARSSPPKRRMHGSPRGRAPPITKLHGARE